MGKPLLDKLRLMPNSRTPIWIMRQAGRYLPEYLEVRKKFKSFVDFCLTPDAAATVTLQPLERFNLDAAIIFSDILLIPKALGMKLEFLESYGPKLEAIESLRDMKKLTEPNFLVFEKVGEAIKLAKEKIGTDFKDKTLIGFAGAPFTIASYMIEGSTSKDFEKVRKFAVQNPKEFSELINVIISATIEYIKVQVINGAEVIKIFDSWAGNVPNYEFKNHVVMPIMKIIDGVKKEFPDIPFIVFARKAGNNLKAFKAKTNIDAYAIDQYTDLTWAFKNLANDSKQLVLQGNFDNTLLAYGNTRQISSHVNKIFAKSRNKNLIFNLGHGILPQTPIDNVKYLVDMVISMGDERANKQHRNQ
jgi:uroporphyrinogen decarboxylase